MATKLDQEIQKIPSNLLAFGMLKVNNNRQRLQAKKISPFLPHKWIPSSSQYSLNVNSKGTQARKLTYPYFGVKLGFLGKILQSTHSTSPNPHNLRKT
jgi:hypothetical protein